MTTKQAMTIWAADHPRPAVLSPCGAPMAPTGVRITESRYESVEFGRLRGGLDLRGEQHALATFSAIQMKNAQVKSASKRGALGPYPWRPPE